LVDADQLTDHGYRELPVPDIATLRRHGLPELGSIRAIDDPSIAERCRVAGRHAGVTVPSLNTGGWYDIFLQGTLDNYEAMTQLGRDARLIVGPWTHSAFGDPIGELCFGLRSSRLGPPADGRPNQHDLEFAWLRRHLEPRSNAPLPEDPVRIFVMGRNVWRDMPSWPPRADVQRWFLHADGALRDAPPSSDEPPTEFVYDPGDPVPTVGGNLVMSPAFPSGPWDQARVEARPDVCVFTSSPLERDLEVTGRVRVVLHAASSAPSTDWVARLCDVHPDGRSLSVCDGIVRVPSGAQACARYEVDLWSTSNVFLRGHRLRVHVTSSSFPRWDRNLNTGKQHDPRYERAFQRVNHYSRRSSYIELPVVT
jgi:putative CocE/NonD family hydrolase